jgi:hypothetical protein
MECKTDVKTSSDFTTFAASSLILKHRNIFIINQVTSIWTLSYCIVIFVCRNEHPGFCAGFLQHRNVPFECRCKYCLVQIPCGIDFCIWAQIFHFSSAGSCHVGVQISYFVSADFASFVCKIPILKCRFLGDWLICESRIGYKSISVNVII